jgi:hypothetical protein
MDYVNSLCVVRSRFRQPKEKDFMTGLEYAATNLHYWI